MLYKVSYQLREIILAEKSNKIVAVNIVAQSNVLVEAKSMRQARTIVIEGYGGEYDCSITGIYTVETGE